MRDPWKFVAFPVAAILGYLASMGLSDSFSSIIGLPGIATEVILVGSTGLLAGFLIDEVIPVYVKNVLQKRNGGGGGGDFDDDLDDLDFE